MLRRCVLCLPPFALSIFPVVFFYVHNLGRVLFLEAVRPATVLLLATLLAVGIAGMMMRDWVRAGVVVSTVSFGYFAYGNLLLWLMMQQLPLAIDKFIHHPAVGLCFFAVLGWLAIRITRNPATVQKAATGFLLVAAVLSGFNLAELAGQLRRPGREPQPSLPDRLSEMGVEGLDQKPDVYYIILDQYPRSDVLKEAYSYDNGDLMDYLRARGFVIPCQSRSNYCHTYASLASSLNFDFLQNLDPRSDDQPLNLLPLGDLINHNRAARYLQGLGYRSVVLSSGIAFTEMYDADVRLASRWHLSEFEYAWLLTTPIGQMRRFSKILVAAHRTRILSLFENLPKAAELAGPKFVFAHILSPHSPFVFRSDGGYPESLAETRFAQEAHLLNSSSGQSEQRFRQQAMFVTEKVRKMVDGILSRSARLPIIILQSDHGNGPRWNPVGPSIEGIRQRSAILNAYLLPPEMRARVYETITPVNSFPLIFNAGFGANFSLSPDRVYFSQSSGSRQFVEVATGLE